MQEYYLQLNFPSGCSALSGPHDSRVFCHAETFFPHSDWPDCADMIEVLNPMAWVLVDRDLLYDLGPVSSLVDAC